MSVNHAERSFIPHTPSRDEIDSAVRLLRGLRYTIVPPVVDSGAGIVHPPAALDINWRTLTYGSRRIQLSPFHARIVEKLIDSSPAWCSRNRLRRALWGDNVPSSDPLPVHMYAVREKLRDLTGRRNVMSSSRAGFRLSPDLLARR